MRTRPTLPAAAFALFLVSANPAAAQDPQVPTIPQDSAESACKAVLASLAQGEGGAIWAMMPDRYQQDLQSLMRGLASKVPADLWNETFGFFAVVRDVLKSKKQFILAHPMFTEMGQETSKEQVAATLDTVVTILDGALQSDLATAEKAREIDLEKFFVSTGSEVLGLITTANAEWIQLDNAKVEVVGDATATEATLRISMDDEVHEEPWSKVDGKWIPAAMATAWDESITTANAQLSQMMDEMDPQTKMQISGMLGMFRGIFTQLANAESQEDFNTNVAAIMQMAQMFR